MGSTTQWFDLVKCSPSKCGFYFVILNNGDLCVANYQSGAFIVFDKDGIKDDRWFTDDLYRVSQWAFIEYPWL